MRTRLVFVLIVVGAAFAASLALFRLRTGPGGPEPPQPQPIASTEPAESAPPPTPIELAAPPRPKAPVANKMAVTQPPIQPAPAPLSKADRLAQLRESFRALAAGDPRTALGAARQLTDETERETALLALVTEWKHGDLTPPRQRAWAIASYGLEAGLGMELASNPELAQLWANELAGGQTRAVAPEHLAAAMVDTDPAAALAFGQQLGADDRHKFLDSLFATWAQKDTEAALQQAGQMSDPTEQEAALKAIRSVAPVGIGAELRTQDGYAVIGRLLPGTPAELGGLLHPGDRIVAVAQGDYAFVDARGMAMPDLVQAIRGAPGSLIQLQVLSADAPADSQPRMVSIVRGQIKFKR